MPTASGPNLSTTLSRFGQPRSQERRPPPNGGATPLANSLPEAVSRVGDGFVPKARHPVRGRVARPRRGRLGSRGAFAAVGVFETHHVVQVRSGDLEDRRVLERRHTVDGPRWVVKRRAGA